MSRWGWILVTTLHAVWLSAGCHHAPQRLGSVTDLPSAAAPLAEAGVDLALPPRRLPAVVMPLAAQGIPVIERRGTIEGRISVGDRTGTG